MSAAPPLPKVCLSDEEMEHLADSPMPKLQVAWLDAQGWPYVLSRKGRPRVARAYVEQRLGVQVAANDEQGQTTRPDWNARAS